MKITGYALLLLLTTLLLPLTTLAAAPAPNWYDVEMIVFQNTRSDAGSLESWPANPGAPAWETAQTLNPANSNLPYRQLPPSSYRLDGAWSRLSRSSGYAPLLHVAWAQPAIDRASAPFVQIGSPASAERDVYGIAKLSTVGPYLHFDIDLWFCGPPAKSVIPALPAASSTSAPETVTQAPIPGAAGCQPYRLREDRKLDAGKLNYFDNPMFGALILISPRSK